MTNVQEMMGASSCSAEAKQAGQEWLDAVGTDKEHAATRELIEQLMLCVMPIDDIIAFASSEDGEKLFGKERAAQAASHAKEIKQEGVLYCDCPACTPAKRILERRTELA